MKESLNMFTLQGLWMRQSGEQNWQRGEGDERIYVVEPTGDFEDDPNVTDKKFPGNPTKSNRSKQPLKIVAEVIKWEEHSPDILNNMLENLRKLSEQGIKAID